MPKKLKIARKTTLQERDLNIIPTDKPGNELRMILIPSDACFPPCFQKTPGVWTSFSGFTIS
jgi:hypothetical protein